MKVVAISSESMGIVRPIVAFQACKKTVFSAKGYPFQCLQTRTFIDVQSLESIIYLNRFYVNTYHMVLWDSYSAQHQDGIIILSMVFTIPKRHLVRCNGTQNHTLDDRDTYLYHSAGIRTNMIFHYRVRYSIA